MSKKAQAAVEYLQTYGLAILVVIILGVSMWQLGVFSPPKANVVSGFSVIRVLEPSIRYRENTATPGKTAVENNLRLTFMNGGGTHIHDLSIALEGDCQEYMDFPLPVGGPCEDTIVTKEILAPAATTNLTHNCCKQLEVGDPFFIEVNISYTIRVGEEKVTKKESGTLQGYVE